MFEGPMAQITHGYYILQVCLCNKSVSAFMNDSLHLLCLFSLSVFNAIEYMLVVFNGSGQISNQHLSHPVLNLHITANTYVS